MKNVSLIGIPLDLGAETLGVDIGPNAFRDQNIVPKLTDCGMQLKDLGNIHCKSRNEQKVNNLKLRYLDEILRVSEETVKIVTSEITSKQQVIALGGDHSIAIGTIAGASLALNKNIGVIWIDAHGDINTHKTTLTGNIHGMPLASVLGLGHDKLVNVGGKGKKVEIENVIHVGGCDFDLAENEIIKNIGLFTYKIDDILARGLAPLLAKIDELLSRCPNIWVSLDLDSIDSTYAPGVGMPNKGGLSYREIEFICEYIGSNTNIIGADIVEYNPLKDIEGKTSELAIELTAKLLGANYSWYSSYLHQNRLND